MMSLNKSFESLRRSNLRTSEKCIILKLFLQAVLADKAPKLIDVSDEFCITEYIQVLSKSR